MLLAATIALVGAYFIKFGELPSSRVQALKELTIDIFKQARATALMWKNPDHVPVPNAIDQQLNNIYEVVSALRGEFGTDISNLSDQFTDFSYRIDRLEHYNLNSEQMKNYTTGEETS